MSVSRTIKKLYGTASMISWPLICYLVLEPTLISTDGLYLTKHMIVQFLIFIVLAHIPCMVTGVMWWVDLAWPVGLVALGVFNYCMTQEVNPSLIGKIVCVMFIF